MLLVCLSEYELMPLGLYYSQLSCSLVPVQFHYAMVLCTAVAYFLKSLDVFDPIRNAWRNW